MNCFFVECGESTLANLIVLADFFAGYKGYADGGVVRREAFSSSSIFLLESLHFGSLVEHISPRAGVFVAFGKEEQRASSDAP